MYKLRPNLIIIGRQPLNTGALGHTILGKDVVRYPVLSQQKIGFIGAGNMAEALIRGLIGSGVEPKNIYASAPRKDRGDTLTATYGICALQDNAALAQTVDVVILAIKPQVWSTVVKGIADVLPTKTLVVSVIAGVCSRSLEEVFPEGQRVVRAMPNTPALVGYAATALSPGNFATKQDVAVVDAIFRCVGIVVQVAESQLDAVTGLSGSGPAYIFLILDAMADAGVKVGLSRRIALSLAAQTVLGSAKMLMDTKEHPGTLKDMVTSPGGCAIAGLHTLEEGGLRTTLINAVEAATNRAMQLGKKE